jgi:ketosteroid isomerase-like protein
MTDIEREAALDLARRLFTAVAAGDLDAVRAIYAPDAVIWHNTDGVGQTVEQNLAVLAWLAQNVTGTRYDDVRLQATETGFVQQHVMRGRTSGDAEITLPGCIVCTVAGGRITRLDEYLDSAHLAPLLA